jgi:hypothetical protein
LRTSIIFLQGTISALPVESGIQTCEVAPMRAVIVLVPSADLAEAMTAMRYWLDSYQIQPSLFRYHDIGGGELLMELDFPIEWEAEAFVAGFGAHHSVGPVGRIEGIDLRAKQRTLHLCAPHFDGVPQILTG